MQSTPTRHGGDVPSHEAARPVDQPHTGSDSARRPSLRAVRYWCAHVWVEVLPDGTCFITRYDGGSTDTGTIAARTEAALATVAFRIERDLPLAHTAAWADPDRWIPALDERGITRDRDHRCRPVPSTTWDRTPRPADDPSHQHR